MTDASRPTLLERHNSICKMLREGTGDVRCSSIDNIMPGCYVRTLAVYECTEGAAAAVAGWPAAAESLRTSLLAFVDRYLPHLSCQMFRDETRGGLLYVEGPVGRRPPHFASAVVDDWVPARADVLDGRLADWPAARLNLSAADDEPAEQQPADTATRRYNPVSLKIRATLCHKAADPAAGAYIVFVYKFHHEFMDAGSMYLFPLLWSAFHRGDVALVDADPPLFVPDVLQGELVVNERCHDADALHYPDGFQFFSNDDLDNSPVRRRIPQLKTVRLRFSNAELSRLQTEFDKAQPLVNATTGKAEKYSKNDVLVAMMWKGVYCGAVSADVEGTFLQARAGEKPAAIMVPIGLRDRFGECTSKFIGNALAFAQLSMPLAELQARPLVEVAAFVHAHVRVASSKGSINNLLYWYAFERKPGPLGGMFLPSLESLTLTSWALYPIYEPHFSAAIAGGAKPMLSTIWREFQIPSLGAVIPTPPEAAALLEGGGGVDIVFCLAGEKHLEGLLAQPGFCGKYLGDASH